MSLYGPEARVVQSGGRDEVQKCACMGSLHEHKGGVAGPHLTSTASPCLPHPSLLPPVLQPILPPPLASLPGEARRSRRDDDLMCPILHGEAKIGSWRVGETHTEL